jgi:hypothetical protein
LVNLPAAQPGCLVSLGLSPDCPEHFGFRRNGSQEVLQPHNDDFGVSPAVNNKSFVLPPGPAQDLAELGPSRKGRYYFWHGHNCFELINQFIHIMAWRRSAVN